MTTGEDKIFLLEAILALNNPLHRYKFATNRDKVVRIMEVRERLGKDFDNVVNQLKGVLNEESN